MSKPNPNFPWIFLLLNWLERKFLNCVRNFSKNRNWEILTKWSWLAKEAWCNDDAKRCNFPPFWLVKEAMAQWRCKTMWWSSSVIGWKGWEVWCQGDAMTMQNDAMADQLWLVEQKGSTKRSRSFWNTSRGSFVQEMIWTVPKKKCRRISASMGELTVNSDIGRWAGRWTGRWTDSYIWALVVPGRHMLIFADCRWSFAFSFGW